jgi:hypothetical protein
MLHLTFRDAAQRRAEPHVVENGLEQRFTPSVSFGFTAGGRRSRGVAATVSAGI